jgi:hypothetical protein
MNMPNLKLNENEWDLETRKWNSKEGEVEGEGHEIEKVNIEEIK